jgi:hypothetical protein
MNAVNKLSRINPVQTLRPFSLSPFLILFSYRPKTLLRIKHFNVLKTGAFLNVE